MIRRLHVPFLTLLARIAFSVQQWGVIALLAQRGDDEALGLFGLALALVTILNGFFNLGLRQGIATDIDRHSSLRVYAAVRITSLALSLLVIPLSIGMFWQAPNMLEMTLAVVAVKTVDLLSEFSYGVMQLHGKETRVATSQILRAVAGFLSFWLGYESTGSVVVAANLWAITWLFVFMLHDLPASGLWPEIRRPNLAEATPKIARSMARLALVQLPFGVATLAGNVGLAAPRVLLEYSADLAAVGVFTALWSVFQAAEALVIAVLTIYLTPLARALRAGARPKVLRMLAALLAVSGIVSVLGVTLAAQFGSDLLDLLYGQGYGVHAEAFTVLAVGWSIRYLANVLRTTVTARRRFWAGAGLDALGSVYTVLAGLALFGTGVPMVTVAFAFALGQAALLVTLIIDLTLDLRRVGPDV